jgi:hypothetical protein
VIDPAQPDDVLSDFEFAWAVYDTQDKCWLGNDKGPLLYTNTSHLPFTDGEYVAKAAATIANERMLTVSRFRARLFEGGQMMLRDEVKFRRTATEALAQLESRGGG